jgi:acetyl esterase/lipase
LCTSGGGFIGNSLCTNQSPWARLAKFTGLPVIAYEYRVAPEAPFDGNTITGGQQDAQNISKWLAENATNCGFDPKQIILCGDSSGGNFALYQALYLTKLGVKPAHTVVISAVTDLSRTYTNCDDISAKLEKFEEDESVDVLLSAALVEASYELYATKSLRKSPIVSPLYLEDNDLDLLSDVSFVDLITIV